MLDIAILQNTELSNDLAVITQEILDIEKSMVVHAYEIGRRLHHVKTNDLAHGQWINWLETVNLDRMVANQYISIFTENILDYVDVHTPVRVAYEMSRVKDKEALKVEQNVVKVIELDGKKVAVPTGKFKLMKDMSVKQAQATKQVLNGRIEYVDSPDTLAKMAELEAELAKLKAKNSTLIAEKEAIQNDYVALAKDVELAMAERDETVEDYKKRSNASKIEVFKNIVDELYQMQEKYFFVVSEEKLFLDFLNNTPEYGDKMNAYEKWWEAMNKATERRQANIKPIEAEWCDVQ